MTPFVLVGMQRTGTTWIRSLLDSQPGVLCIGEAFLFTRGKFFRRARGHEIQRGYRQYIEASWERRLTHHLLRPLSVRRYLDELYSTPGYAAIGFKLMQSQYRNFPAVMKYVRERDMRVIHVVRRNTLKTLVSRTLLQHTQLAHSSVPLTKTMVYIDPKTVLRKLSRLREREKEWERIYAGLPVRKVYYEDVVADKTGEVRGMLNFLGVEISTTPNSPYVKINPDDLREVIINYEEVCAALAGTEFESCLREISLQEN